MDDDFDSEGEAIANGILAREQLIADEVNAIMEDERKLLHELIGSSPVPGWVFAPSGRVYLLYAKTDGSDPWILTSDFIEGGDKQLEARVSSTIEGEADIELCVDWAVIEVLLERQGKLVIDMRDGDVEDDPFTIWLKAHPEEAKKHAGKRAAFHPLLGLVSVADDLHSLVQALHTKTPTLEGVPGLVEGITFVKLPDVVEVGDEKPSTEGDNL